MSDEYYIALIQKEQSEGLTPDEQSSLRTWLASDPIHREMYTDIQSVWTVTDAYTPDIDIDLASDYAKVQEKIDSTTIIKVPTKTFSLRTVVGIAASLLLIAGFFMGKGLLGGPQEQIVAVSDNQRVELPDGSLVKLRKGSRLSYKTDWSQKRNVELSGSAYFDVASDTKKPFIIKGEGSEVTVLGTRFLYESIEGSGYVDMMEGKVQLRVGNESKILTPGNNSSALYSQGKIEAGSHVDPDVSWYIHEFEYRDEPLSIVVEELGAWYDRSIILSEELKKCTYSGRLDKEDIGKALTALKTVFGADLKNEDEQYIFVGGSCL